MEDADLPDAAPGREDYKVRWGDIYTDCQHLVLATHDFIVVIDRAGDVDWQTSTEWDNAGPKDRLKHNSVLNDVALLEAIPCGALSPTIQLRYKRLIGESIARNLHHDYPGARRMLAAAGQYVRDRSEEMSRRWYLSASAAMAFLCLVLGAIVWSLRAFFVGWLGSSATWLLLAAAAGAGGALLSVIGRTGRLHLDCSAGRRLHYLEGVSRIWAGGLSGFLAGLAVKSEILLAPLTRAGKQDTVMLLAAFAAGAGERLATSIISRLDSGDVATTATRLRKEAIESEAHGEREGSDNRQPRRPER